MSQSRSSSEPAKTMQYDIEKVDEVTMALLYLTVHDETHFGARAWKGFDWETLNRLHAKGMIELFMKHFGNVGTDQRRSAT